MSNASLGRADPAPVFAALGDGTRLKLVVTLSDGRTRSIATLAADAGMTRQAVTKHLDVLERAGLVTSARAGRERGFAGRPEPLAATGSWLEGLAAQWDARLARLRAVVEDPG